MHDEAKGMESPTKCIPLILNGFLNAWAIKDFNFFEASIDFKLDATIKNPLADDIAAALADTVGAAHAD